MVILDYSIEKPLNREPPIKDLISSFITSKGAYDRNHGPIPHLDSTRHIVRVDGQVLNPLELNIAALSTLPQHEVICALQCAGNRRHTMRTRLKEVDGIDWRDGAVMNCAWRGPLLRDVLLQAGVNPAQLAGKHVAFACHQTACQDDSWYGGSIPLARAMDVNAEVILALRMNGEELPLDHGAPVRVIAPGIAGARSVKWLDRVTVQGFESRNFYMQRDYKVLPPQVADREAAEGFWEATPAIMEMPVNSVVGVPESGETIRLGRASGGMVVVRGYALPRGSDGPIVRVEVSTDGENWEDAELVKEPGREEHGKWCWVLWRAEVKLEVGKGRRILSRATDKGGNVQEKSPEWNLRGVGYNGYGESRDLTVIDGREFDVRVNG